MNRNMFVRFSLMTLFALSAAVTAQQPLTPEDDWVSALRAGGNVVLGPGAFYTTEYVELSQSLDLSGQGAGVTSLWFASDGGEYGEQLVLLADIDQPVRFRLSNLDISYDGDEPTDLVVLWGPAHLTLDSVNVNYAFEDPDYLETGPEYFLGSGLLLGEHATALVVSSTFYTNGTNGITALWAERLVVSDSTFVDNWWAGVFVRGTPVTVTRSHFELNDVGIEIYGSEPRILSANTFLYQFSMDVYEEN
mgnify:CR=1 FL=1